MFNRRGSDHIVEMFQFLPLSVPHVEVLAVKVIMFRWKIVTSDIPFL
jgi:hypothetical protein